MYPNNSILLKKRMNFTMLIKLQPSINNISLHPITSLYIECNCQAPIKQRWMNPGFKKNQPIK